MLLDRWCDGHVRVADALVKVVGVAALDLQEWGLRLAPKPMGDAEDRSGSNAAADDDAELFPPTQAGLGIPGCGTDGRS